VTNLEKGNFILESCRPSQFSTLSFFCSVAEKIFFLLEEGGAFFLDFAEAVVQVHCMCDPSRQLRQIDLEQLPFRRSAAMEAV